MIRYHARWVLPISSAPLENGTVGEDGGHIVFVGPRADAPPGDDVELGEAALLPGLVNAHTHLELTALRGSLERLPFHRWMNAMRDSRDWLFSGDVALDSARLGVLEGLGCGTTTFADTSATGMSAHAMAEAGVRGIVFQEVFGPDPAVSRQMMAELRDRVESLRSLRSPLLDIGISPHAPFTVSDDLYADAARYAADERLPVAVHIAESAAESELVTCGSGVFAEGLRRRGIPVAVRARSPIELLERCGVLAARPLLIHCVQADSRDVDLIASSGCAVAHCPVSNAKLGHGIAPLTELLDRGVAVGLGTDSVASNNRMDLLDEARTAALFQRARTGRFDALSARAAIELATLGGARSLGLADGIGSLEVGKSADLAAFTLPETVPADGVESALLFSLYQRSAMFVAVAGRALVSGGHAPGDSPELRTRVAIARQQLAFRPITTA